MRHVFVETNWVFAYAAPAHHKRLDAVELLARARANEVRIHLPAPCLTEARLPIMRKCQPRNEFSESAVLETKGSGYRTTTG